MCSLYITKRIQTELLYSISFSQREPDSHYAVILFTFQQSLCSRADVTENCLMEERC